MRHVCFWLNVLEVFDLYNDGEKNLLVILLSKIMAIVYFNDSL